ncbi:hypothetical protein D6D11_02205 [Aureobasidium pullulans]|nr:hypothetical protein D6D11_02205 [Aureobasidium pullulans]
MHISLPARLLTNITVLVPNGTTQHGNERILCLPITSNYWPSVSAVAIFFATHFLSHAATVKSGPGDATIVQACNAFLALMFPMSGFLRALNAIFRYSRSARNELDKARDAGALCMVVRSLDWQPKDSTDLRVGVRHRRQNIKASEQIDADWTTYLPAYARERSSGWVHFDSVWASSYVDPSLKRIHGTFLLPEGYTFAVVPRDTFLLSKVEGSKDQGSKSDITASKSIVKAVASIVQIVAALTTLLSHRSDLVVRWGYASYHLTVIPYLFMTLVNLISNLVIADYPCLYMVRTDTMAEAETLGGSFEGEVAQTISRIAHDDSLVEDLAYTGMTNEDIAEFVAFLIVPTLCFWQPNMASCVLPIPLYFLGKAKARKAGASKSTTVDMHIHHAREDRHVGFAGPGLEPEVASRVTEGQRNLSSGKYIPAEPARLGGVEVDCDRHIEAQSSSHCYSIRLGGPRLHIPFYEAYGTPFFVNENGSGTAAWPVRAAGEGTLLLTKRIAIHFFKAHVMPRLTLNRIWRLAKGRVRIVNFNSANIYYPSCTPFLRTSDPDYQTMMHTEGAAALGPSGTLSKISPGRTVRTRYGVILELAI